jgi:hypothetical protein
MSNNTKPPTGAKAEDRSRHAFALDRNRCERCGVRRKWLARERKWVYRLTTFGAADNPVLVATVPPNPSLCHAAEVFFDAMAIRGWFIAPAHAVVHLRRVRVVRGRRS